jgi:hypothetical protein
MTTALAERRKGRALTLLLIAAGLAALAAVTVAIESRSLRGESMSGPVVPGLSETIGGAQRIVVTSADASYRIERTQRGWAMRDRGDFPVLSTRLAQLTEGLESLRFTRRMTSDPSKHDRLGVSDPRGGGDGVLVQIEDGRGALLVNLILGVEPSGLYVRRPDGDQTWAAEGDLPPLRDVATWLDLRPIEIAPERLARVEIIPSVGRPYILARDTAEQPWRIASPALSAMAQSTVTAAAERITQLAPVDVQPAPAVQGAPSARVRATTFDGLVLDAELIPSDGRTWLKLVARSALAEPTPEQDTAALEINNRAAAWAYALSELEVEQFAPPLSNLVPSIGPPPSTP